jgi:gamma-glutamylcyclotransferase (GGCT)/AIG2-like uncharacterized protein YtfP
MRLYFAYGSNMDRAHMEKLCRGAEALGAASAENNIYYVAASGYATIAPRRNSRVHGVLWKISAQHIAKLDAYESVETGLYVSAAIPVRHNGKILRAMIYYAAEAKPGRPKPGYQENVIAAAKAWNFPQEYIEHLEKFLPPAAGGG